MPVGSAYRGPIVPLAHGDQVARRAVEEVTRRFGPAVKERTTFRGEETLLLEASRLVEACAFLKDDPDLRFDVLTDVMAAHFLDRDYDYEVAYVLSSYPNNAVLRLKVRAGGRLGPGSVPTVTGVWATADWQEREEWDKVGVLFSGHPNLKRILMPDDWEGHPLRRDYPMEGIGA